MKTTLPIADVAKFTYSQDLIERLVKADQASASPNGIVDQTDPMDARTRADYFEVCARRDSAINARLLGAALVVVDVAATVAFPVPMLIANAIGLPMGAAFYLGTQD